MRISSSIPLILSLLHVLIPIIHGQICGPDCSICNASPVTCTGDTVNRCIFDFGPPSTCTVELCGPDCSLCDTNTALCNADPLCYYLTDNQLCRLKDTCHSDCTLCQDETNCEDNGAGGNICDWLGFGTCIGSTCNTNCEQCPDIDTGTVCNTSTVPPNGCFTPDPDNIEICEAKTPNPTREPTLTPTNKPTNTPTHEPTNTPSIAPTVSPTHLPLSCDDTLSTSLSDGTTVFIPLIITTDLTSLIITLCSGFTNFNTTLTVFNDTAQIGFDNDGCNDAVGRSELILYDIEGGIDYSLLIAPAQYSGGLYRVEIICNTESPTSAPTDDPTQSPNVGADEIGCNDDLIGYLPPNDVQIFSWILAFNTSMINITLCFDVTDFATELVLLDDGNIVENETQCTIGDATFIEVENGLNEGIYSVIIKAVNDGESGNYRIQLNCFTEMPTHNPTVNPTNNPSVNPTHNPSLNPTKHPTHNPTLNPSVNPTDNPTIDPSVIPTHNPTTIPSVSPTIHPSVTPTQTPTHNPVKITIEEPTNNPSFNPTDNPTTNPTFIPTQIPTNNPTFVPTINPTMDRCPDCVYNVSLIMIGNVSIEECTTSSPTPTPTESSSDSSDLSSSSSDSSSSSSDSSSSSSDSNVVYNINTKCISWYDSIDSIGSGSSESDDGTDQGSLHLNIIDSKQNKCDGSDSNRQRLNDWNTNGEYLSVVCITYQIIDLTDIYCGEVRSVFLGLCENNNTDFNSHNIDEDDLTALIVSIWPNDTDYITNVEGARNDNDDLGILVEFTNGHNVDTFELCLGNVTVDREFNKEKETIDIGNGTVTITDINNITSDHCVSDGLPCLNFVFNEECPGCQCIGGIKALTMKHNGECKAQSIIVYYDIENEIVLCSFDDVSSGDIISCKPYLFDRFNDVTYIKIEYDDYDCIDSDDGRRRMGHSDSDGDSDSDSNEISICIASFITDCSFNLIGKTSSECGLLTVLSFIDGENVLCYSDDDGDVVNIDQFNINSDSRESEFNALLNGGKISLDALETFVAFDPLIKWVLIIMMMTFIVLIFVSFYLCIVSQYRNIEYLKKNYQKKICFNDEKRRRHRRIRTKSIDVFDYDFDDEEDKMFDDEFYNETDIEGIMTPKEADNYNLSIIGMVKKVY